MNTESVEVSDIAKAESEVIAVRSPYEGPMIGVNSLNSASGIGIAEEGPDGPSSAAFENGEGPGDRLAGRVGRIERAAARTR